MFVLDIETLDTLETCVILSLGAVWFDENNDFEVSHLKRDSFFVKFSAVDQVKRLKRTISSDTLDFWTKQDEAVKKVSYHPATNDVPLEQGMADFTAWYYTKKRQDSEIVFTRGSLDYSAIAHASRFTPFPLPIKYWQIRDVRTAVDILAGTTNGYCRTTKPIIGLEKHHPVDDCIIDAMMLKYYVEA